MGLKSLLKNLLSEKELEKLPSSFEIIGSREKAVAIVEIPNELSKKEKLIAEAIIKLNKNVKTVLKKISKRKGKFRLRNFKILLGEKDTEVIHKEYGYFIKVDPRKVYFSARESTERQRVATQVKPNEIVLVMFSGVAPFGIAISKKQPNVGKVYCIELNKKAHEYAKENVRINKVSHLVVPILGDVKKVCPKFFGKCDRVIMPLPEEGWKYLELAIKCLKKKGVIHFYFISDEKEMFKKPLEILEKICKKLKVNFNLLSKRKVLPYAPRKWKVCLDVKIVKSS